MKAKTTKGNKNYNLIKQKLLKFYTDFKSILSESEDLIHIQFLAVSIILTAVAFVMTIMNSITGWHRLMWSTLIFAGCCLINTLLSIKKGKLEIVARVLFAFEITALFTFFLIVGDPEGFSAIWIALLPACGLLLYHRKIGSILSLIQFLILIFFFWTPWGKELLIYKDYSVSFMERFPVLYISFYVVGLFFETLRSMTSHELLIAKNKYANLYSEEKIHAEQEKEQNFEIIKVLASEYSAVYYVDLKNDQFEPYTMNEQTESKFGDIFKTNIPYSKASKIYVKSEVIEEDQELMLKATDIDYVREQLLDNQSFVTRFRSNNDGEPHYCEMKFVRVLNEYGIPEYAALGFEDKNEQIKKEEEYQQTLKDAKEEAEKASAAKTKFLFNMSHDIRTPMNAIIGFTDMANKYINEPEKALDYIDKVKVSSKHLLELINNVLDMSRIESGKVEIETSITSLNDYVSAIETIAGDSAKEKNISFTIEKENITHDSLYIDTLHTNQIMLNLIGNSVKYTKPNGSITFIVKETASNKQGFAGIDFIVKDTGIGMSKDYIEHIYEAFTREFNTTMSGVQGTGLGMSITKRLVDLMNGTINIDSELGVGTTTTVHLDLQIHDQPVISAKAEEVAQDEEVSLEGSRLLLVDDNDLNREIAKDILEEVGIIIEEANDGTVAVEMVQSHEPTYYDYVLMDVQMPYMDGYKATRAIRTLANNDYSNLPIIAMTANAFEEDRKNAFDAGMNEHLAKPIDIEKTLNTLKTFLKKK